MINQIKAYLSEGKIWEGRIQYFETITSTNDVLKELAKQNAPHGTVLIADCQTGGRGRLGRTFLSPAQMGIYMSVLLRPDCMPGDLMHLTCAAAEAACDAFEKAVGIRPSIKWTNDIVFLKRKLAGILTEVGIGNNQKTEYVIIGIGVNCSQSETDFPEEIRGFAGSLAMVTEKVIDRARVAAELVNAFASMNDKLLTDKANLIEAYRRDCITIGEEVSVIRGEEVLHGVALDINSDCSLMVRFSDGTIAPVNSGEVSVRGLYHYV